MGFGFIIIFMIIVELVVKIAVAYFLYSGLSKIPREYQNCEPYFAWLILIPLAGLVFMWILLPFKIPESMEKYFKEKKSNKNFGDYGKAIGLGSVIFYTIALVPYITSGFAWLFSVVLLILYVVKFDEMIKEFPNNPIINNDMNTDKFEQLMRLKKLLDDNAITNEEYQVAKKKIL